MPTKKSPVSPKRFYYFNSTHWDREWYQPLQKYRHYLVQNAAGILDALEHTKDFQKFVYDGQTIVLEDICEIRPELRKRLEKQIKAGRLILRTLGLRRGGIEVVSCPTCGRTRIDLISLAAQVEELAENYPLDIKVAVMGCVVNGPGEAREADLGIAGGKGEGLLFRHGEILRKVPEAELLSALKDELDHWKE